MASLAAIYKPGPYGYIAARLAGGMKESQTTSNTALSGDMLAMTNFKLFLFTFYFDVDHRHTISWLIA